MLSSDQSFAASPHVSLTDLDVKDSLLSEHADAQVQDSITEFQPDNGRSCGNNAVRGQSGQEDYQGVSNQIEELKKDLNYIRSYLKNDLNSIGSSLREQEELQRTASCILNILIAHDHLRLNGGALQAKELSEKLCECSKIVFQLKLQIPLPHELSSKDSDARRDTSGGDGLDEHKGVDEVTELHLQVPNEERPAFKDFLYFYNSNEDNIKMCLLCFAAIPENEIIRKRFMLYWWISEGFLSEEELTEESYKEADRIFEELEKNNCIKPANGDRFAEKEESEEELTEESYKEVDGINEQLGKNNCIKLAKGHVFAKSYKMDPSIRSAVIVLAKKASFFDFHEEKGYPSAICWSSYRACLVKESFQESMDKICELKRVFELVKGFCKGLGKRHSRTRSSAFVKRLQAMEIDSKLVKKLLEEEINFELAMIERMHLGSTDTSLVKRLQKHKIDSEFIKKVREKEIHSKLIKRLLQIDPEFVNLVKRLLEMETDYEFVNKVLEDLGKGDSKLQEIEKDSELVKRLQEIEMDFSLVKRLWEKEKESTLVKRLWKIKLDSALIKRLPEIPMDSMLVKRLLKMKIGTQLVERLLNQKICSQLVDGFFLEFSERFSQLQRISKLVNEFSKRLPNKGSKWVNEFSGELTKLGTKLVDRPSKALGEISAELIHRFSIESTKKGSKSFKEFFVELQKVCTELQIKLSYDLEKVGAGLFTGSSAELLKRRNKLKRHCVPIEFNEPNSTLHSEKVQIIFNVNEPYPDIFDPEWFSRLKLVKVLYLGRWQTSPKHHIELESIEFLKGLRSMRNLKFFSLQGISRITNLPDSVCRLFNLRILDLKACHDLQELPKDIGLLTKLRHLDISECHQLNHMPKTIVSLSELQVLKGFIISSNSSAKSCNLRDLAKLEKLRKLSIYTNRHNFPLPEEVTALVNFNCLKILTVTWGTRESSEDTEVGNKARVWTRLSNCFRAKQSKEGQVGAPWRTLQKLDLKCYQGEEAFPERLLPSNLPELEKLYIRGGQLQHLAGLEWKVKILRLRFLNNLKMPREKLRSLFPQLDYLEIFKCSELTDEVWWRGKDD